MTADLGEFRIEWEWEPAPSVRAPEHRATWARIEIAVGPEHVTLVEDKDSASSRRAIYCPLYPLAEWVAYNWWLLQADSRPAIPDELLRSGSIGRQDPEGVRRHCMRSAGDGFLWPNLLIVPEGSETLLRWSPDHGHTPDRRTRYLSQGYRFVPSTVVAYVLSGLVESVIARLRDQHVTDAPLVEEWNAIQQADDEERQFCLAAARLGLDPYSDGDLPEDGLLKAGHELSGDLLNDFLDAVNPKRLEAGLSWVTNARSEVTESAGGRDALLPIRSAVRVLDAPRNRPPWQIGYLQARRVRDELGLAPTDPIEPAEYVTHLTRPSENRRLQALGGIGRNNRNPTVVVGGSLNERARHFTLSRALWHFLAEDDPVFLVTASYTNRQKVERAFAAELLAPAAGIEQRLSSEILVEDDLEDIADHFGVSVKVVEHQIQSQLTADSDDQLDL